MNLKRTCLICAAALICLPAASAEFVEGSYKGTYKGTAENSAGEIRLTLSKSGTGWSAGFVFTAAGQEVKCKSTTVEATGEKLKLVCAWEVEGYSLETTSEVESSAGKLEGKYQTIVKGDVSKLDEGTWSASLESKN